MPAILIHNLNMKKFSQFLNANLQSRTSTLEWKFKCNRLELLESYFLIVLIVLMEKIHQKMKKICHMRMMGAQNYQK